MHLQLHKILPGLQHHVKLICSMDCHNAVETQCLRVLPDTCVELFINYTATPIAMIDRALYSASIINSRMSKPAEVQMRKGSGCIAVCFYPGTAYRFFQQPMQLLSDRIVELSEIWRQRAHELEDKLASQFTNEERAIVIQEFLLQELRKSKGDKQIDLCLQLVESSSPQASVTRLCKATGLSQRQLARKFQEAIGLSPKGYLRVNRFLYSLKYLQIKSPDHLTTLAYASGYYDQAHYIRDCRKYSGLTPKELIASSHILY